MLLALTVLMVPQAAWAGDGGIETISFSTMAGSPKVQNATPLALNAFIEQTYTPGLETRKIRNIVTLSVWEETPDFIPADFTATVDVSIQYGTASSNTTINQQLAVTYTKAEGVKYNARQYFSFEDAEYVKVTVTNINAPTVGGFNTALALKVQNEMRVTRYYTLNASASPATFTTTAPSAGDDELNVTWSWPANTGNTHTQLEWTWIEDDLAPGTIDYNAIFQNNATRVDLPIGTTSYKIPLLYGGAGRLFCRVRPVNIEGTGSRTDGPWALPDPLYQTFNGHNNDLNWQATITFAEEGKRAAVIKYFDGSLRSRQTVTKDNTTNTVVAAETLYDGQGRPAIQVLPAAGSDNVIKYSVGLNLFKAFPQLNLPDQLPADDPAKYFDMQPIASPTSLTPGLQSASGAAYYYSGANTEKTSGFNAHIPDAEGYPYTVTRFTPDATGRIMAESDPGAAMQMSKGHETKYYYGTPSQEELDGLFGTEVGNYTHYFKNMIKDANGQMNISYTDMHGRTIATALAGDAPTNLVSLNLTDGQYPNQTGTNNQINRNLLSDNSNVVKNNSIEAINSLLVPATTNYTFKYELNPQTLQMESCTGAPICYDCLYDLEISITDESGDKDPIIRRFKNVSLRSGDDCNSGSQSTFSTGVFTNVSNNTCDNFSNNVLTFCESLQPGSYTVRKTLTISESSLQTAKELYLTKGLCKTEQQLVDSVYGELLKVSTCDDLPPASNCADCLANLGNQTDYRNNFLASIGNPSPVPDAVEKQIAASYNAAKQQCDKLCNTTSQLLSVKRQLMLADMMPYSGQYAKDTKENDLYDKYNIFSTAGASSFGQPFYRNPRNSQGLDLYRTNDGSVDLSIQPNGSITDLSQTPVDQFAAQFATSWAEALLPYHPEYNKLVYAENTPVITNSYNWITTFNNTTTYADAVSKNYIFTDNGNLNDPLYAAATTYKPGMVNMITNNYQQNLSLWQLAYGDAACKTIIDPTQKNNCYTQAPKTPAAGTSPSFSSLTTAQKDKAWVAFRTLYAMERDNHLNAYINDQAPVADAQTLVDQGYILHFPANSSQMAQQFGTNQQTNLGENNWAWFPTTPGGTPNINSIPDASSPAQTYASRCNSYVPQWVKALMQCTTLANHPNSTAIINQITAGMVAVCQKGSDEANPFGSSTVPPATPMDGTPRSFEEVITNVFKQSNNNITWDNFCNPYVIEFPKPYSKGPVFTKQVITAVEDCHCSRFIQLKTEAIANGKDPNNLASFNEYLQAQYGETFTQALYDGLVQGCPFIKNTVCTDVMVPKTMPSSVTPPCGCEFISASGGNYNFNCPEKICNTINPYPLTSPQPMPAFLKCGYEAGSKCITCAQISTLTGEFKQLFPSPYNGGPVFTGDDLTTDNIRDNVLFAQFLNFRTGLQLTWIDYAKAAAAGSCDLAQYGNNGAATQQIVCADTKPLTDRDGLYETVDPCQKVRDMAVSWAQQLLQQRTEWLLANFEKEYRNKCLNVQSIEQFNVDYKTSEYHYTLYYYDLAGNLVTTVPPKGVYPKFDAGFLQSVRDGRIDDTRVAPPHSFLTNYRYNSLNEIVAQNSPDAGTAFIWYDKLGRVAVSQNARQADAVESPEGGTTRRYTYTMYDELGRISEVGQKPHTDGMSQVISQDPATLNNWINGTGGTKEQIIFHVYDMPYVPLQGTYITQQNLRNRISYRGIKKLATDPIYYTASFFTYDVHGNVEKLLQDYKGIPEMDGSGNRFKLMTYDYDLISGKTNKINYQPGQSDAFYHRYTYDAENRLVAAETSRDNIYWEQDASYLYYKHGPLARAELGKLQVQGLDYAYTLQGWLKGVNGTTVGDGNFDIGKDGYPSGNSNVARDVLGFGLHYYDAIENGNTWTDYKTINGGSAFAAPGANSNFVSLYDGNIGGISMNNAGLLKGLAANTNALPLFYNYRFDQLNRLVSVQAYKGLNTATNQWSAISIDDYAESITYDPNGNIKTYNRKGAPEIGKQTDMDAFTYNYNNSKNQLNYIQDGISAGNYAEDLNVQSSNNYTYDASGNLKSDLADGITDVIWTMNGKIASVTKDNNTINYTYDASGNRISKNAGGITTIYVRDGAGNTISLYEKPAAGSLTQTDLPLYGNNRLGLTTKQTVAPTIVNLAAGYGTAAISTYTRNEKVFELNNHLGNVLVTVGDKKIQHSSNASTVDFYTADVMSAGDYYAFGMAMPGRSYSNNNYRYGFNGQERSTELNENSYSAEFWQYDGRIGRRWNVDPIIKYWESPYACFSNNPISRVDPDGDSDTLTQTELDTRLSSLKEKDRKLLDIHNKIVELKTKIDLLKKYFNIQAGLDLGMSWNPLYWIPREGNDAVQGEGTLDMMARNIASAVNILEGLYLEYNKINQQFKSESTELRNVLSNTTQLSVGPGILLLNFANHKNSKAAQGSWRVYEILVDGYTFRFGIADAARLRKTGEFAGLPERLAQQLSKIRRNAPNIHLNWEVGSLLKMSKAEALVIEAEAIVTFARKHGIPLGNIIEIKRMVHLFGRAKLGARAAKVLSKFLKF